ncbi:MAG: oligogalacturonate lyase family protein [Bryobacterales bacterium]|nr:oligogalacturonate lyase family protein [Bryobacteraceae bacterium]MDW8355491.1 oligogalacturonate lyase family protein [Bryobacterales bacterium]
MKGDGNGRVWTRRALLSSLAVFGLPAADEKGRVYASEKVPFLDRATEFEVFRLTAPAYTNVLTAHYNRCVSRRGHFLVFASDRTGSMQAFRMDLKSGAMRLLTASAGLIPDSLCLLPDDRSFCYLDGDSLHEVSLSTLRDRQVYRCPAGWRPTAQSVAGDGRYAAVTETDGKRWRLRLIGLMRNEQATVTESDVALSEPQPRPKRDGILYRRGERELWLVHYDGQDNRRLKLPPGGIGPALWAADGRSVLYLHFPEERRALHAIREHTPDTHADQLVSPTSQFVHFGRNADASVFVGASRNPAAPHILLLLRVARRELTLCEHRASDPSRTCPIFAPDSQHVFFQSDKDGKPAIYCVPVDKLVEKTET